MIKEKILEKRESENIDFEVKNTVCGHVSCREPALEKFSCKHDVIIFVSGKNSSNGKMLFEVCKKNNNHSYFVSEKDEIDKY